VVPVEMGTRCARAYNGNSLPGGIAAWYEYRSTGTEYKDAGHWLLF
jgi:hypothetical protein